MTPEAEWISSSFPELLAITKLGEGGQKLVFAATHASEGDVVLKLIRGGQDPVRIQREIEAQAVVSGRVPRVLDAGVTQSPMGPIIWLREQRVMGESIRTHLRRGPLALTQAIKLGLHVLEALADAERCRIVHRDVKPDNVMMDLNGDFWLLDFGSARHLDLESLTATSPFGGTGTPGYAPPEQYQNRKSEIDARADLFALGVTLYEAISGANPHTSGARDVRETLRRVDGGALPLLSIKGDSGGKISEFVTTLAQPRREHRPRSVAEALAWLSQLALENSNRGM